ncbi:hypothetical protein L7F22_040403 [Adiantum nelumboides]|nr:hypothetical protein [Adiantum nelumboides]
MATARRCADLFFSAFFALHVLITLFVDAQVLIPARFYPSVLRNLLSWYISFSGDYLVRDTPPFFKGLVYAEIFLQLPLVIANAYAFYHGMLFPSSSWSESLIIQVLFENVGCFLCTRWAKTTGLIYGVHTATTMIPILTDVLSSNVSTKATLMGIYIPYLMIPLALTFHVLMSPPSVSRTRASKARKRA